MTIDTAGVPPAPDYVRVRRALISVFDKSGLIPFAQTLAGLDIEIVSSGGTARHLREAGLDVIDVDSVTGSPAMLGGRVKTLHPLIHGAILTRRDMPSDELDVKTHQLTPIDLVVVNLYPFQSAVNQPDVTDLIAAENIDIGGPAMLRAAAKNFAYVGAVGSADEYAAVSEQLLATGGSLSLQLRRSLAARVFKITAGYDAAITTYLSEEASEMEERLSVNLPLSQKLRYGENPHQDAGFYGDLSDRIDQLHGKPLSFNNLIDLDAALALIREFDLEDPTIAILKHTNPCGVATAATLNEAWDHAFATDTQSPFGGIVVMNRPCTRQVAEAINTIFTELIVAPDFEPGVLDYLKRKKNRRLIQIKSHDSATVDMRSVLGGMLCQDVDPPVSGDAMRVVTRRAPTSQEMKDLLFAWRIAKHVKSNAIVYARNQRTLGIGAGQMSRIDASEIAVAKGEKSGLDFKGCVVASDAFFPFADGLIAAADSGACAAAQPGGSIRDEEVIAAADARNMAMVFTGKRHFRH